MGTPYLKSMNVCMGNTQGKILAKMVLMTGYYQSSIVQDSKNYVMKCEQFRKQNDVHVAHLLDLNTLILPCLFSQ